MTLFGTDGIRGRVGDEPMTPETVLKLGWAFGQFLKNHHPQGQVLIGKDTRASGYIFESVLEAGLLSAGVDVGLLGPLPTPGVAALIPELGAVGGISISASHNPYYDNGVKFFTPVGGKLSHDDEQEITSLVGERTTLPDAAISGKASRIVDAQDRYVRICSNAVAVSLTDVRLVVDCANGAAYHIAGDVYQALGASVDVVGAQPDGFNINKDCGTMHPSYIQELTVSGDYDCGIAVDGDGDRLIMVDATGQLIDGDEMLYIIANYRRSKGQFDGGVVGTEMSNTGLEQALRKLDIDFERAAVGDRHVLAKLKEKAWQLGGESSGHLLSLDKASSCDALINSLILLQIMIDGSRAFTPFAQLLEGFHKHHQTMINVDLKQTFDPDNETFCRELASVRQAMSEAARILVRPSGTEPVLRVMVESQSQEDGARWAQHIARVAKDLFGS